MKLLCQLSIILFLSARLMAVNAQSADELLDIAYTYEVEQPDSALFFYEQAARLYRDSANWDGLGRAFAYSGIVCSDQGRFGEAMAFIDSSNIYWTKVGYKKGLGSNYNNLANIYLYQDFYKTAATAFTNAANIFEELNDTAYMSVTYANLGNVYIRLKRFDEAVDVCRQNVNLALPTKDSVSIGYAYIDMGATYIKLEQYDSVKYYLDKAKPYSINSSDGYLQLLYHSISCYYHLYDTKDYQLALMAAKSHEELSIKSARPIDVIHSNLLLGQANYGLKSYSKAIKQFKNAIDLSRSNGFLSEEVEGLGVLAKAYEAFRNYDMAYQTMSQYASASDSVLNKDIHQQTQELLFIYETAKKDNEILEAQLEIKEKALVLERNRYFQLGLIGFIILLIIIAVYQINRVRLKKQAHQQHLLLLAKEEELKLAAAQEEAEEEERNRIAAELHDGVNGMLAGIKFHMQSYFKKNKLVDEQSKEIVKFLGQASTEVRSISHKLGSTQLKERGLKGALEQFVQPMTEQLEIRLSCIQGDEISGVKEQILFRSIQEMVFNAFKHAEASSISIDVRINHGKWTVVVKDDGKGMGDVKNGFGLESLSTRFEKLNGKLKINTSSEGTELIAEGWL